MKQIIKNVYHVGDNDCSVYMVDTQSDRGLVVIDAGMDVDEFIRKNADPVCLHQNEMWEYLDQKE